MIKKLSLEDRSRLRSTVIINGYRRCLEEIVVNSLDAGASEIVILVDFSEKCYIEVCDNGRCMTFEEMSVVGKRYYTSKSSGETYYGYRGESLASIIDTCRIFNILCLTGSHKIIKSFEGGNLIKLEVHPINNQSKISKAVSKKTIISITDLYYKTPVRFKAMNKYYEQQMLKSLIESLALINFSVCFKLQFIGSVDQIYEWKSCSSMLESSERIFRGQDILPLESVKVEAGVAKLEGFVGIRFGMGMKVEFLYLNERPISSDDKMFRKVQKTFSKLRMKIVLSKESCLNGNDLDERAFSSISFILNFTIEGNKYDTHHDHLPHFHACMEKLLKIIEPKIRAKLSLNGSAPFSSYKDLKMVANKLLNNIEELVENMTPSQNVYKIPKNCQPITKENSSQSSKASDILHNSSPESQENVFKSLENNNHISFINSQNYFTITEESVKSEFLFDSFDYHENVGMNYKFSLNGVDPVEGNLIENDSSIYSTNSSSSSSSISSSVKGLMGVSCADHLAPHLHKHLSKSSNKLRWNKFRIHGDHGNKRKYLNLNNFNVCGPIIKSQMIFNKEMFASMQVIGQVDKKFIACLVKDENGQIIVLVDQHAADERIRLERLLKDIKVPTTKTSFKKVNKFKVQIAENKGNDNDDKEEEMVKEMVMSKPCLPNIEINLPCDVVVRMELLRTIMSRNGLKFKSLKNSNGSILITDVPLCFDGDIEWIKEFIFESLEKGEQNLNQLPSSIFKRLCSIACHGAIKFGDFLSNAIMTNVINKLGRCDLPFQCAHGRPTIIPLLDVNPLKVQKFEIVEESFSRKLSNLAKCNNVT